MFVPSCSGVSCVLLRATGGSDGTGEERHVVGAAVAEMDDEPRRLTALHLHVEAVVAELGGGGGVVVRDRLDALDAAPGKPQNNRRAPPGGGTDPRNSL